MFPRLPSFVRMRALAHMTNGEYDAYSVAVRQILLGDDMQRQINQNIKETKESLSHLDANRREFINVHFNLPEDKREESRWFYELVLELLQQKKQETERLITRMLRLRKDYKPKKQELDKQQVKQIPILDLYPFEKIRQTQERTTTLCPFHQERSPSFVIYHKDNTFHCFGCNTNGDNIDFIMQLQNTTFKDAIKILSTHYAQP